MADGLEDAPFVRSQRPGENIEDAEYCVVPTERAPNAVEAACAVVVAPPKIERNKSTPDECGQAHVNR
ncbi:hypothetical protein [Mesorhizobium carmichaelinearum]|uniref:hypothetical protein n=1 Tax=Mesorhizobium carmichaelinearum TaxID=1208188 RepID=UPI001180F2F4|nr:hypothetical protein [Mesorhizobium carmichaelinearum]